MKNNKEALKVFLFSILLIGTYIVSGVYGLKIVIILLLFTVPFYLILNLFDFNLGEKIIFALFISLAFFSLLIYWINQLIPSYRHSIIISYVILIGLSMIIRVLKKGDKK